MAWFQQARRQGRGVKTVKAWLVCQAIGLMALAVPCAAGIYGVPTNLSAAGVPANQSANPPGFFNLDGLNNGFDGGDGVHQIRLKIEVTSTTLDVMIFDPGTSGSRDLGNSTNTTTTYTLLNPAGTTVATVAIADDATTGTITDNRLVRFGPSGAFFTLDSGAAGNVSFAGLSPGLYELRITTSGGTTETNIFGLDIRQAKGSTAHYNVYTIATDNGNPNAPGATETAWLAGATTGSPTAPSGNITQPLMLYAFVDRGCTIQTSNFDMDFNSGTGAGGSGSILDTAGASTALTMSNGSAHSENTITVETTAATNLTVDNYGMYLLTNNLGGQNNAVDWRVSDFQGSTSAAADEPVQPTNPIRMYLPNGYAPTAGNPGATAPVEPVLALSARVVSGANPPVSGQVTRFAVTATVANQTANAITAVQVTVGHQANETNFSTTSGCVDGVGGALCPTVTSTQCTDASAGTFRRCSFATLAAGSFASMNYEFDYTPPGTGLRNLTGPPVAGSPVPTSAASATYTPASSSDPPGSPNFTRTETLGPACQLLINVGGGTLLTRATLRGLRVTPAAVEFAVGSQHESVSFDLYGTSDPRGRAGLVKLLAAPIPASPSSFGPAVYRADVALRLPYLMIEERDARGRRHVMGPVSASDPRLRAAFDRIEAALERAGSVEPPSGRARVRGRFARSGEAGEGRAWRRFGALRGAAGGGAVAVEVRDAGPVRIPVSELSARGLGPARKLQVSHGGSAVEHRLEADPSAGLTLVFEAARLVSDYAPANVYVVSTSAVPPSVPLTSSEEAPAAGFTRVARYGLYLARAPEDVSPWMWDLLFGDGSSWPYDWWDPTLGDFDLPGLGHGTGNARVRVRLFGFTDQEHAVEAFVNGVSLGSLTFSGAVAAVLEGEVPLDVLRPQGNQLSLRYTSGDGQGLVYLRSLDLQIPLETSPESVAYTLGTYDPRLPGAEGVEYLIVTHAAFQAQADRVASLKRAQGYRTAVVDVERAYDRFSGGIFEANAIRELVRHYARAGALRYVLLVGDDTFDYHDYARLGAVSYVPSLLAWDGEFGRIPSENRYADTDDDGQPDVAIGRLPVQTAEEADVVVEKIARQGALVGGRRHLAALDDQAPGDNSFRDEAGVLAASLPPSAQLRFTDVAAGVAAARAELRDGFGRSDVVHYFGHGGPEVWADESLLSVDDVPDLPAASPAAPVLFAWACESQWYQYIFGPTIDEALLLKPGGGVSAALGPVGISSPALQRRLAERVYRGLFERGLTLGEAVRRAKAETLAADPAARPVVDGFGLIGDPSLRLSTRPDVAPGGPSRLRPADPADSSSRSR